MHKVTKNYAVNIPVRRCPGTKANISHACEMKRKETRRLIAGISNGVHRKTENRLRNSQQGSPCEGRGDAVHACGGVVKPGPCLRMLVEVSFQTEW